MTKSSSRRSSFLNWTPWGFVFENYFLCLESLFILFMNLFHIQIEVSDLKQQLRNPFSPIFFFFGQVFPNVICKQFEIMGRPAFPHFLPDSYKISFAAWVSSWVFNVKWCEINLMLICWPVALWGIWFWYLNFIGYVYYFVAWLVSLICERQLVLWTPELLLLTGQRWEWLFI